MNTISTPNNKGSVGKLIAAPEFGMSIVKESGVKKTIKSTSLSKDKKANSIMINTTGSMEIQ